MKGWVRIFSYTQPREAILDYDRWYLKRNGGWQARAVLEGKRHGKTVIALVEGVNDRDGAAALVDIEIAVEREALPAAEDGSYYWADLEGLPGLLDDIRSWAKEDPYFWEPAPLLEKLVAEGRTFDDLNKEAAA